MTGNYHIFHITNILQIEWTNNDRWLTYFFISLKYYKYDRYNKQPITGKDYHISDISYTFEFLLINKYLVSLSNHYEVISVVIIF